MGKKLAEEQIIRGLKCLGGEEIACAECEYSKRYKFGVCRKQVAKDVLDLIHRQKAENESLQFSVQQLSGFLTEAKARVVKEFAERLKDIYKDYDNNVGAVVKPVLFKDINTLVKEMEAHNE